MDDGEEVSEEPQGEEVPSPAPEQEPEPPKPSSIRQSPSSKDEPANIGQSPSIQDQQKPYPETPATPVNSETTTAGPIGPLQNTSKIVTETLEIVACHLEQINKQKHFLASMAYLAKAIQDNLERYKMAVSKMDAFVKNNSRLQERWYEAISRTLPCYGDYALVLEDSPETVVVDLIPAPVPQHTLRSLVGDVVNTLHAGAVKAKTMRGIGADIYRTLEDQVEVSQCEFLPVDTWLMLLGREIGNEEKLEDKFFQISSYVDFMNLSFNPDESQG